MDDRCLALFSISLFIFGLVGGLLFSAMVASGGFGSCKGDCESVEVADGEFYGDGR